MKREKLIPLISGAILLFLVGVLLGKTLSRPGRTARSAENVQPSGQKVDVPVQTVPGVSPEMLSAGYWTDSVDDVLLFSEEEIALFNENNPPYVLYNSIEEQRQKKLFLYNLPVTIQDEIILSLLDRTFLDQMRSGEQSVYINGSIPQTDYWDTLEANCRFDSISPSVTPVYAVCVRRTMAQRLPTDDFASESVDEHYCSDFVSAEIMPCTGVAVLHESADGAWKYVLAGSFCGWVHSDALALCRDRDEWIAAIRPKKYLIVTGSELILDETAVPTAHSGSIYPMGTKLRLTEETVADVNGRSTLGCYCVELPCVGNDGSLCWEKALIGVTQDVHVGYPPMTSGSVVEQAFKLLGRVYGWGGSLRANDCSGIVRQIYVCFGLELPRNALAIAKMDDLGKTACTQMTVERKLQILSEMPAGTLLYMDGHLMMYLGMRNNTPYVISSCTRYINPGDTSGQIQYGRCVFVSGLDLLRANGKTWLEDLSYILWKEY